MEPPSRLRKKSTTKSTNTGGTFVTTSTSNKNRKTDGSAKTKSASSNFANNSHVIVALCEGRGVARGIVGIAAMDVNKPVLILCQISDTQTYRNTLTKVNILQPVEVLIPASFVESNTPSRIFSLLKNHFPTLTVSSVARNEFSRFKGLSYVNNLCATEFSSVTLIARHKFYALASASALLKYIEKVQHVIYSAKTIKVEYQEPENTTVIDIDSADRLELVASGNQEVHKSCLLAILDHCVTEVGRKMLRATILQPPCVFGVIIDRLDCVQELLANMDLQIKLKIVLTNLHNIEYVLLFGSIIPVSPATVSNRQLFYILQLKSLLASVDPLRVELESSQHPVLRRMHGHIVLANFAKLLGKIQRLISEDAHIATGHDGDLQRCFAIKTGVNGFLDIARRAYAELVDDMRGYVLRLVKKHNLPLRIHYSQKKSFHIILNLTKSTQNTKRSSLPSEFLKVEHFSSHFTMTTSEMINYGVRIRTNCQEIESISNVMIYQLLMEIKSYIGHLYQLCDDVALLDVLQSLATTSNTGENVRPQFTTEYTEIIGAKHPLLQYNSAQEPIPNPVVASNFYNMHIVTGPNMSGKSVYVRQIPLIQILAQVGCYVPARSAVLCPCSHIYVRIGLEDIIHDNGSTTSSFQLEMAELQYVLNSLGMESRSLVILDELCHSTSVDEGVSVAMSICEQLLKTRAYVYIATHFLSLTKLADLYFNVKNWHLEAIEFNKFARKRLKFTHRLKEGVTSIDSYGIKLARICGGSDLVTDRSEQVLEQLLPLRKTMVIQQTSKSMPYLKYRLYANLKLLELQNKWTPEAEQQLLDEFEFETGNHYEIGQFRTAIKTLTSTNTVQDSRTTTSGKKIKNSAKLTQSLASGSCQLKLIPVTSDSHIYSVAKISSMPRANVMKCKSLPHTLVDKLVDSLNFAEEDFVHIIMSDSVESEDSCSNSTILTKESDPLGFILKQTQNIHEIHEEDIEGVQTEPDSPNFELDEDSLSIRNGIISEASSPNFEIDDESTYLSKYNIEQESPNFEVNKVSESWNNPAEPYSLNFVDQDSEYWNIPTESNSRNFEVDEYSENWNIPTELNSLNFVGEDSGNWIIPVEPNSLSFEEKDSENLKNKNIEEEINSLNFDFKKGGSGKFQFDWDKADKSKNKSRNKQKCKRQSFNKEQRNYDRFDTNEQPEPHDFEYDRQNSYNFEQSQPYTNNFPYTNQQFGSLGSGSCQRELNINISTHYSVEKRIKEFGPTETTIRQSTRYSCYQDSLYSNCHTGSLYKQTISRHQVNTVYITPEQLYTNSHENNKGRSHSSEKDPSASLFTEYPNEAQWYTHSEHYRTDNVPKTSETKAESQNIFQSPKKNIYGDVPSTFRFRTNYEDNNCFPKTSHKKDKSQTRFQNKGKCLFENIPNRFPSSSHFFNNNTNRNLKNTFGTQIKAQTIFESSNRKSMQDKFPSTSPFFTKYEDRDIPSTSGIQTKTQKPRSSRDRNIFGKAKDKFLQFPTSPFCTKYEDLNRPSTSGMQTGSKEKFQKLSANSVGNLPSFQFGKFSDSLKQRKSHLKCEKHQRTPEKMLQNDKEYIRSTNSSANTCKKEKLEMPIKINQEFSKPVKPKKFSSPEKKIMFDLFEKNLKTSSQQKSKSLSNKPFNPRKVSSQKGRKSELKFNTIFDLFMVDYKANQNNKVDFREEAKCSSEHTLTDLDCQNHLETPKFDLFDNNFAEDSDNQERLIKSKGLKTKKFSKIVPLAKSLHTIRKENNASCLLKESPTQDKILLQKKTNFPLKAEKCQGLSIKSNSLSPQNLNNECENDSEFIVEHDSSPAKIPENHSTATVPIAYEALDELNQYGKIYQSKSNRSHISKIQWSHEKDDFCSAPTKLTTTPNFNLQNLKLVDYSNFSSEDDDDNLEISAPLLVQQDASAINFNTSVNSLIISIDSEEQFDSYLANRQILTSTPIIYDPSEGYETSAMNVENKLQSSERRQLNDKLNKTTECNTNESSPTTSAIFNLDSNNSSKMTLNQPNLSAIDLKLNDNVGNKHGSNLSVGDTSFYSQNTHNLENQESSYYTAPEWNPCENQEKVNSESNSMFSIQNRLMHAPESCNSKSESTTNKLKLTINTNVNDQQESIYNSHKDIKKPGNKNKKTNNKTTASQNELLFDPNKMGPMLTRNRKRKLEAKTNENSAQDHKINLNRDTKRPRIQRKRGKAKQDSLSQNYSKLETFVSAPGRSKKQRAMDKFFEDIKKKREDMENISVNPDIYTVQYCPTKKQLAGLECIAVGHRDSNGNMKVTIGKPKPTKRATTDEELDAIIEKYCGKNAAKK